MTTSNAPATEQQHLTELLEEAIADGRLSLPLMPEVAARIKVEVGNPHSSAHKLAAVIATDAALAARVLRMANSAIYAGMSEICELDQAIVRLGSAMVVALAVGAAGKETFRSEDPGFAKVLRKGWEDSLRSAAFCRRAAPQIDHSAEEAFLAGLMRRAGEPILFSVVLDKIRLGKLERPDTETARRVIARLAPRAGGRLLGAWGLPRSIVNAVARQYDFEQAEEEYRLLAALTGLSGLAAANWLSPTIAQDLASQPTAEALGLDAGSLSSLIDGAREDWGELAPSL